MQMTVISVTWMNDRRINAPFTPIFQVTSFSVNELSESLSSIDLIAFYFTLSESGVHNSYKVPFFMVIVSPEMKCQARRGYRLLPNGNFNSLLSARFGSSESLKTAEAGFENTKNFHHQLTDPR